MSIKKAAVIGAGVMGSGIAAQLANAGIEVELLDMLPRDPAETDRDAIAKGAIDKMLKNKQNPFMAPENAKKIRPGNTEDHYSRISDCDLIIEVVFEDPAVKSATFKKIDQYRKPGSIIGSNTSTIPLAALSEGQSEQFKKDFVITHFFNPPRYMELLEIVTSEHNDPAQVKALARFMDEKMGKGVIFCKDTPGFIGNRIGVYWLQTAINEAIARGLMIEEADAIMGKPLGIPNTGVFGLTDMVGLDLMPKISQSFNSKLPTTDAYVREYKANAIIDDMIKNGYVGLKSPKGGFYRRDADKNKFSLDLQTGEMRPTVDVKPRKSAVQKLWSSVADVFKKTNKEEGKKKPRAVVELDILNASKSGGIRGLVSHDSKYGEYAWTVLKKVITYAAEHVHEICDGVQFLDEAMKSGYRWEKGPFELADKLGVDYIINRLEKEGEKIPAFLETARGKSFYRTVEGKLQNLQKDGSYKDVVRPEGVLLLEDIKRASKPIATAPKLFKGILGATLWDIGDGVLCVEFDSIMNSLDPFTMKIINKACDLIEKGDKYKALVVHNSDADFSLGANLKAAAYAAKWGQNWGIEAFVRQGQETYMRLKRANFPVVSAPTGKALGGGCEILLHSHHVQAHAELYTGLVEVGVGLLPAWGGTTEMLTRFAQNKKGPQGPMPAVISAFQIISTAKFSLSAQDAKKIGYLKETDGITMNRFRLLADAKAKALEMVPTHKPAPDVMLELPGPNGRTALSLGVNDFYAKGMATSYDVVVSDKVARVLTGGDRADIGKLIHPDYIRELEGKHFMELVEDKRTIKRIVSMIWAKKPLREKERNRTAHDLRTAGTKPHFMAMLFKWVPLKSRFNVSATNDNRIQDNPKAKMNWPTPKKK